MRYQHHQLKQIEMILYDIIIQINETSRLTLCKALIYQCNIQFWTLLDLELNGSYYWQKNYLNLNKYNKEREVIKWQKNNPIAKAHPLGQVVQTPFFFWYNIKIRLKKFWRHTIPITPERNPENGQQDMDIKTKNK